MSTDLTERRPPSAATKHGTPDGVQIFVNPWAINMAPPDGSELLVVRSFAHDSNHSTLDSCRNFFGFGFCCAVPMRVNDPYQRKTAETESTLRKRGDRF